MTNDTYFLAIQDFINFVNEQQGMYVAACSGFAGNKRIVERQTHRDNVPSGVRTAEDGTPVIMRMSLEDPSQPDFLHHRILKVTDFLAENERDGNNAQQAARAILIFIYAYWELEIRVRLAYAGQESTSDVKSEVMGDVRILRNAILHDKVHLSAAQYEKLKTLNDLFSPESIIIVSSECLCLVMQRIKQDMARLLFDYIGEDDPKVNPSEIRDLAIQFFNKSL